MSDKEFYIGWNEEMPKRNSAFLKKLIISVLLLLPLLAWAVISNQQEFNHHHFDFGNQTELTGILHLEPVPILEVQAGVPEGFSKNVLLVGFGKFGVEGIIEDIEKEQGVLSRKEITLKGTLIYGDGITLFELTNLEDSFSKVEGELIHSSVGPFYRESSVSLSGEILDPKCYFGVMKPGEGKIHKSCAIRCLSGGIPPVMRVKKQDEVGYEYYLIQGENGEEIGKELIPIVAQTVEVSGNTKFENGWKVIYADVRDIKVAKSSGRD